MNNTVEEWSSKEIEPVEMLYEMRDRGGIVHYVTDQRAVKPLQLGSEYLIKNTSHNNKRPPCLTHSHEELSSNGTTLHLNLALSYHK
jgi:hypothetical protein